jgi:hypothetical protein
MMLDPAGSGSSIVASFTSTLIMAAIFISSLSFILSTLADWRFPPKDDSLGEPQAHEVFGKIELICLGIFTVEYVARFCTAHATRKELLDSEALLLMLCGDAPIRVHSPLKRLGLFIVEPSNLIDLCAIAPSYIEMLVPVPNLTMLRMVRLTRVLRVMRIGSIQDAVDTLGQTLVMSSSSLYVLAFYIVLFAVISSTMLYYIEVGTWTPNLEGEVGVDQRGWYEREIDGEKERSPFTSIPEAIWFVIVTVTTVGYGDFWPKTGMGKLVGSLTIVGGVISFAMPAGVISSNFARVWEDKEKLSALDAQREKEEAKMVSDMLVGANNLAELHVSVWDDDGLGTAPEFLGEVHVGINTLGWVPDKPAGSTLSVQLENNPELSHRFVTGTISLSLLWEPDGQGSLSEKEKQELLANRQDLDADNKRRNMWDVPKMPHLHGALTVMIIEAQGVLNVDTKVQGLSDPFCRVSLYPKHSASPEPTRWETKVVKDSLSPYWGESRMFLLDWRPKSKQADSPSSGATTELMLPVVNDDDAEIHFLTSKLIVQLEKEVTFWKEKYDALCTEDSP